MKFFKSFILLTRPLSNLKVLLLFALAWYLSQGIFEVKMIFGILSISLICSAMYVFNSYTDIEIDKKNKNKRRYYEAVMNLGIKNTKTLVIILLLAGIGLSFLFNIQFIITALVMMVVFYLYSSKLFRFKEKLGLDLLFAGITYPLRFLAGWFLFISIFPPIPVLTLFLFGKIGGYTLYKQLDRKALKRIKIKNTINYFPKRTNIIISSVSILLAVVSFVFVAIDPSLPIRSLLTVFRMIIISLLLAIPLTAIYLRIFNIIKVRHSILRFFGLLLYLFAIVVIILYLFLWS